MIFTNNNKIYYWIIITNLNILNIFYIAQVRKLAIYMCYFIDNLSGFRYYVIVCYCYIIIIAIIKNISDLCHNIANNES